MSQPLFTTPLKASLSIPLPELDDSPGSAFKRSPRGFPISPERNSLIPTLPLYGSIPRITGDTLVSIIMGKYSSHFTNYFIIDCRFSYEYEGGHIKNAINCNDPRILSSSILRKFAMKNNYFSLRIFAKSRPSDGSNISRFR